MSGLSASQQFYRAILDTPQNTNQPVNPNPNRLVWIESGTFTMGSPDGEADRNSDEGPQTVVTLTQGFWMGKTEVTQKEYQAVMGTNPSFQKGDTLPVEQVSWNNATNYCIELTIQERSAGRLPAGYVYRLPTEAEWEYACRAGTTTRYSFGEGESQLSLYAWYSGNSSNKTHQVGTKSPNPWGLHDMHGNVWEWCMDWHGNYPGGSVSDWVQPSTGSPRVLRGGGWNYYGGYCRSALRDSFWPGNWHFIIGFRVVLAPGQP